MPSANATPAPSHATANSANPPAATTPLAPPATNADVTSAASVADGNTPVSELYSSMTTSSTGALNATLMVHVVYFVRDAWSIRVDMQIWQKIEGWGIGAHEKLRVAWQLWLGMEPYNSQMS